MGRAQARGYERACYFFLNTGRPTIGASRLPIGPLLDPGPLLPRPPPPALPEVLPPPLTEAPTTVPGTLPVLLRLPLRLPELLSLVPVLKLLPLLKLLMGPSIAPKVLPINAPDISPPSATGTRASRVVPPSTTSAIPVCSALLLRAFAESPLCAPRASSTAVARASTPWRWSTAACSFSGIAVTAC